jgi:hypothetical protein
VELDFAASHRRASQPGALSMMVSSHPAAGVERIVLRLRLHLARP